MHTTTSHNIKKRTVPNKLYFRIGEVSDIVGVKPYVLRYWETEFSDIRPTKSKSGQRLYKRREVELLLMIRELLYEARYTIDGAKQRLREWLRGDKEGDGELVEPPVVSASAAHVAPERAVHYSQATMYAEGTTIPMHNAVPLETMIPDHLTRDEDMYDAPTPAQKSAPTSSTKASAKTTAAASSQASIFRAAESEKKMLIKLKNDLQNLLQELQA